MQRPTRRRIKLAAILALLALTAVGWWVYQAVQRPANGLPEYAWVFVAAAVVMLVIDFQYVAKPSKSLVSNLIGLVMGAIVINLTFSTAYYVIGTAKNFSAPLTHVDAFYFDLTTFTTAGFGDIVPKSQLAREVVSAELVIDLIFVFGIAGTMISHLVSTNQSGNAKQDTPTS